VRMVQIGLDWLPERAGGLPRYYFDLVREAPRHGVELRGLVAGSGRAAEETGGAVTAFAPHEWPLARRLLAARAATRRLLEGFPPDLVASHFALHALPALDLIGRHPLVVHFHGPWGLEGEAERAGGPATRAKLALERLVYAKARLLIVLSEAFGQILRERYAVPGDKVRVVPGGVDVARFAPTMTRAEARERLGWPADRTIVLAVRRLARRMGLENLILAMDAVRRERPDALLLVGGRGRLEPELRALVGRLGLEDSVRLLGYVSEDVLPLAYRAADLSIVPTVALEGFGLTTLESLASGTPVLVTPVGGLPEAVRGLSPDLVLAGTAPEDLAGGLIRALNGTLPLPSSAACRTYVEEHHAWPAVVARLLAVYREALGG
jgi:glycogen synthase